MTEVVQNTEVQNTSTSITLNDLVILRNIVNIAARRGAFSAEEFSDIGKIFDKLDTFLKENIKQEPSETASTEDTNGLERSDSNIEI